MAIEFIFNTVTVQPGDQIQEEQFPGLISMMNSYLPKRQTPKRRKRKSKKTVGSLIEEIIMDIET